MSDNARAVRRATPLVSALSAEVEKVLGGWSSYTGRINPVQGGYAQGFAEWDGSISLRQDVLRMLGAVDHGRAGEPAAAVEAVGVVIHELAHLQHADRPAGTDPEAAFRERPSGRVLEEGVTEVWTHRHTQDLIRRVGLDQLDPRLAGTEHERAYPAFSVGAESLAASLARRTGSTYDEVLTTLCRADAAQKWSTAADLVFDHSDLPDLLPPDRHELVRSEIAETMRIPFDDPGLGLTDREAQARCYLAGHRAVLSGMDHADRLTGVALAEQQVAAALAEASAAQVALGHDLVGQSAVPAAQRWTAERIGREQLRLGELQCAAGRSLLDAASGRRGAVDELTGALVTSYEARLQEWGLLIGAAEALGADVDLLRQQQRTFTALREDAIANHSGMTGYVARQAQEARWLIRLGERNRREGSGLVCGDLVPTPRQLARVGAELLRTAYRYRLIPGVAAADATNVEDSTSAIRRATTGVVPARPTAVDVAGTRRYGSLGKSTGNARQAHRVRSWTRSGTRTPPAPVSGRPSWPVVTSR